MPEIIYILKNGDRRSFALGREKKVTIGTARASDLTVDFGPPDSVFFEIKFENASFFLYNSGGLPLKISSLKDLKAEKTYSDGDIPPIALDEEDVVNSIDSQKCFMLFRNLYAKKPAGTEGTEEEGREEKNDRIIRSVGDIYELARSPKNKWKKWIDGACDDGGDAGMPENVALLKKMACFLRYVSDPSTVADFRRNDFLDLIMRLFKADVAILDADVASSDIFGSGSYSGRKLVNGKTADIEFTDHNLYQPVDPEKGEEGRRALLKKGDDSAFCALGNDLVGAFYRSEKKIHSLVVVPVARAGPAGALYLHRSKPARDFSVAEFELLKQMADYLGLLEEIDGLKYSAGVLKRTSQALGRIFGYLNDPKASDSLVVKNTLSVFAELVRGVKYCAAAITSETDSKLYILGPKNIDEGAVIDKLIEHESKWKELKAKRPTIVKLAPFQPAGAAGATPDHYVYSFKGDCVRKATIIVESGSLLPDSLPDDLDLLSFCLEHYFCLRYSAKKMVEISLQPILETMDVGVIVYNDSDEIIYLNRPAENILSLLDRKKAKSIRSIGIKLIKQICSKAIFSSSELDVSSAEMQSGIYRHDAVHAFSLFASKIVDKQGLLLIAPISNRVNSLNDLKHDFKNEIIGKFQSMLLHQEFEQKDVAELIDFYWNQINGVMLPADYYSLIIEPEPIGIEKVVAIINECARVNFIFENAGGAKYCKKCGMPDFSKEFIRALSIVDHPNVPDKKCGSCDFPEFSVDIRDKIMDFDLTDMTGGGIYVRADEFALRRVFNNLFCNARKAHVATPAEKRKVRVVAARNNATKKVSFIISDNGPGFDKKALKILSLPPETLPDVNQLHGRGLLIVKKLLMKMGSSLNHNRVEQPGFSTVFNFDIDEYR